MNEQLLQYIWQFQYFNRDSLSTVEGEPLQVVHPGTWNKDQGPDFLNAKLRLGNTLWVGNIELHLKTSDWEKHGHATDKNYSNVILHVVYVNDASINNIPVLALESRVSIGLLERYQNLMQSKVFIPCEKIVAAVPEITIAHWKDRLIAERLTRKSDQVTSYLNQTNNHWEESFWWLLAKNFGAKVNGAAFETLAKSIGISILAKHKSSLQQLEALLLGQAGLLEEAFSDPYPIMLQKEYIFLRKKHHLQTIQAPVHFLRMRPGNFPTLRLAQLAALIHRSAHLFSKILEETNFTALRALFKADANDFWHYHYRLTDESEYKPKSIGDSMIDNIIINTVVPMLFAYGSVHQDQEVKDRAILWLSKTSPEKNQVTKGFEHLGFGNQNSLDSQSLLELKSQYCNSKRCLQCAIGNALLKRS